MSGFIAIHRDIFDHPFFAREPMSEREAFVWMVARAAWKDTRHRVGHEMLGVPRGSFFCTLRELQSAWGWRSDTKVRNFLKKTQSERMVEVKTNTKKTHITICNYDNYHPQERKENAQKTQATPKNKRTENALKEQINNKQITKEYIPVEILAQIVGPEISQAFATHRRELRKPLTENAANAIVKKLEGHHDPGAVLTNSIANGWQGVFPDQVKPTNGVQRNGKSTSADDRFRRIVTAAAEGTSGQDFG